MCSGKTEKRKQLGTAGKTLGNMTNEGHEPTFNGQSEQSEDL